jgi:hypothetical protein
LKNLSIFRQDFPYPRQILKIWCFQWGVLHMSNFHKNFSCEIFHVFLDALPMMVIALFNFRRVKSYGLV